MKAEWKNAAVEAEARYVSQSPTTHKGVLGCMVFCVAARCSHHELL